MRGPVPTWHSRAASARQAATQGASRLRLRNPLERIAADATLKAALNEIAAAEPELSG